jgi:hypothetical protein
MDTSLRWLSKHARSILLVCCGALAGVASVSPLGWHLPDVYANLLGGIVGAVATVAGAFLVLNRQISDATERYKLELSDRDTRDQAERTRISAEAAARLLNLQRAVAPALYNDVRMARVMCQIQLNSAEKALTWPKDAQIAWCERVERIAMPAFDKLGAGLMNLGSLSLTALAIYGDTTRLSSVIRTELNAPERYRSGEKLVITLAKKLPAFIATLDNGMKVLAEFMPPTLLAAMDEQDAEIANGN